MGKALFVRFLSLKLLDFCFLYFSALQNKLRLRFTMLIKIYMLINLDFSNNATLSCFFFFFLITDLYFLTPAVIAKVFNPIAESVIPIGIPTKEGKAEM